MIVFDASTATLLARASHQSGLETLFRLPDGTMLLQVIGNASDLTHEILGQCPCRSEIHVDDGQAQQWLAMAQTETAH